MHECAMLLWQYYISICKIKKIALQIGIGDGQIILIGEFLEVFNAHQFVIDNIADAISINILCH